MRAPNIEISADDEGIILSTSTVSGHKTIYRFRFRERCLELLGYIDYGTGFLVVVTEKSEVITIHGKKAYQIKNILSVPLEREKCIKALQERAKTQTQKQAVFQDSEAEELGDSEAGVCDNGPEPEPGAEDSTTDPKSDAKSDAKSKAVTIDDSIVEEVLLAREYRWSHWKQWFRKRSPTVCEDRLTPNSTPAPTKTEEHDEFVEEIQSKVLKVLNAIFTEKSCYFSYDLDLSRSLLEAPPDNGTISACKSDFYFNRKINEQFRDTTLELPVIQGFVGGFPIQVKGDKHTVVSLGLVSRRSVKRAGVRYLRRGLDEEGNCANCVETEQFLYVDDDHRYSYTLVRGSIPVYFSQSPYKLQPIPQLQRTRSENTKAFNLHFSHLKKIYGSVIAISLVEKAPSREAPLGQLYEDLCKESGVGLEWFDFHRECKGMNFENVESLFDRPLVSKSLDDFGWSQSDGQMTQLGVFRVNCIDCLDRTNVVHAACAKRILKRQFADSKLDIENCSAFLRDFNELWADNGDAISKQYSSTNALKGDFTRTQTRNVIGVLNDAYLTMSRYFHGVVSDFFTQAVMDYVVGPSTNEVFLEFEHSLARRDSTQHLSAYIRDNAIKISTEMLVDPEEHFCGGWWVQTTKKSFEPQCDVKSLFSLEDCILLVTDRFLYISYFDSELEKVTNYYKIDTSAVKSILVGPYITDTLSTLSRDIHRNQGMVFTYSKDGLRRAEEEVDISESTTDLKLVIKLTANLGSTSNGTTSILETLEMSLKSVCVNADIISEPIITLEQAQMLTSMWETLGYKVKKAVWT